MKSNAAKLYFVHLGDTMAKIAIAGASGFVGSRLIQKLLDETEHEIVALSRSEKKSISPDRLKWRKCDIFSLLDIDCLLYTSDAADD